MDDARITSYELLISDDNVNYATVSAADELAYVNVNGTKVATINFEQVVNGRYWKLVVKGTSGKNFTIISEIDAGVQSTTQKVIIPTSDKLSASKGWKDSADIADMPSGYLVAEKSKEKLVIKFKGESFAIYGAIGEGFGTADVFVDGKKVGSVDLNSDIEDYRKLVFYVDNLSDKQHTVEIVTTSSDKVVISAIGILYSAELVNAGK